MSKFTDWIGDVEVADTIGNGWCVRIDGCDVFDVVNNHGVKARRTFSIESNIKSEKLAQQHRISWLKDQLKKAEKEAGKMSSFPQHEANMIELENLGLNISDYHREDNDGNFDFYESWNYDSLTYILQDCVESINQHKLAVVDAYDALEYCIDSLGDEFALPTDAIDKARAVLAKREEK